MILVNVTCTLKLLIRGSHPKIRPSRLHRTPTDPYTVGKSAVGSFQHCARPPRTRARTGDTRTDTRALPACQRCRRVPQARASATHARLLLHTIETSAPAASRRYADAAQRPTLARVVKVLPQDASAGLRFPEQKIGSVRNIPEHCSRGRLFGTDWNRAGTGNDRKPSNPS